jgi:hypothetical protein
VAAPEVDKFGKFLVNHLRDGALDYFEGLTRGRWKSATTQKLQADLASLSAEQRAMVQQCLTTCVDHGIHDFLMALGEAHFRQQGIQINVDGQDVAEVSDGLEGEPHGAQGWIAKFSKYPHVAG